MHKALVVGGNSGIGLSCVLSLLDGDTEKVYIVGKELPNLQDIPDAYRQAFAEKTESHCLNLVAEDYSLFREIPDIDILIITAGFGRVCLFNDLTSTEISNMIKCNELAAIQIIKHYYHKIFSDQPFYTAVMGSIAGHLVSPLFSVYGASKSGLCAFMENVNVELIANNKPNRILDVSPGSIQGTRFSGAQNNLDSLRPFTDELLSKMFSRERLFIPKYDEVYRGVLQRYHDDGLKFGLESYSYKTDRISSKPQTVVGYLSGTFDLFHIGHLNLLRRAKEQCDYLIVGVHRSGAWKGKETFIPFEERRAIISSIKYVDLAIESFPEDCDAYDVYHYDKLFVGSDYKGTPRFAAYEAYFKDKNVEIVYFPYTQGTSSTQLRTALTKKQGEK